VEPQESLVQGSKASHTDLPSNPRPPRARPGLRP